MTQMQSTGQTNTARPTIMLIDGFGLIFRAFHAIQGNMSTSSGELTNAVYGFASMLLNVLNNEKPDYAIVALEGGKTFRHEAYPEYKANRAEMPQELRSQIGRIRQLIEVFNIPVAQVEGFEADDVIGSLAKHCSEDLGLDVVILTGDTDLLQLVADDVEVVLPGARRFDEFRRFDRAAVIERYGFGPELVPDYKALVGDTSDNIPGVTGIGEKTATALIKAFGNVDSILANVQKVEPARAKNALEASGNRAHESRFLTQIVQDLVVPVDLDQSGINNFDRDAVVQVLRELEFRSLLNRLPETNRVPAQLVADRERPVRITVTTELGLVALVDRIRQKGVYAIDVETTDLDPFVANLVGVAIAVSPAESYYIPLAHSSGNQLSLTKVQEHLGPVLADPGLTAIAHHGKFDAAILERQGMPLASVDFDTMIAAFLLGENSVGLKDLSFNKLGNEMTEITSLIGSGKNQLTMDLVSLDNVAEYACGDVEATFALRELFEPQLSEQNQEALFRDIEIPLIPVLADMEKTGVAVDLPYLSALSREIAGLQRQAELAVYEIAGRPFNINSTRQLASLLFEELNLPSGRRTKTGFSVDQEVLEASRNEHPIVGHILDYRAMGKLLSTYVDALPRQINPITGRVHTSFNQTVAATGRLSSTNPNLQNIPVRTEIGRRVRHAFVADLRPEFRLFENAVLISADYSQIELRLMAHLSQEPFLLDAFRQGQDVHTATAALVYGVPAEAVTSDMRRVAKTVNFGLMYGMQAFGLSRDTGLSRQAAQQFIDDYWSRLPQVRNYIDQTIAFGALHGYVETLSGRRRAIPDLQSSNGARRSAAIRVATNMPVQGTAADIMKIAMIRFHEQLNASDLRARLILQVHDELVIEADRRDLVPVAKLLGETMSNAYPLSVPLETEVQAGPNWEELAPVDLNN